MPIDFAFEKLNMRHVGGKLVEHGVERYPVAEPDFGPGVVVKCAAQIDDADDRFRRDAGGAGEGVE